jgi:hypothetical protein
MRNFKLFLVKDMRYSGWKEKEKVNWANMKEYEFRNIDIGYIQG